MKVFMNSRMRLLGATAWALLVVSVPAFADQDAAKTTHDGKLVRITDGMMVMTNEQGQKVSHTFTADAKLTLDGMACRAADLKPGTRIRVTSQGGDKGVANRIEAIEKNQTFASANQEGKIVSISGTALVMTGSQVNENQTCTLAATVKITCDGRVCTSADLKPGMRIRVTAESDDPHMVNQVEALDKNSEFART
jgi:hypothetical protein